MIGRVEHSRVVVRFFTKNIQLLILTLFHIKDVPHNVEGLFLELKGVVEVVLGVLEIRDFDYDHHFFHWSPDRKLAKNGYLRLFRARLCDSRSLLVKTLEISFFY